MVLPYISSIDILGFDNLLQFPHSAVFSFPPDTLVPFHEFKGKGLFVPLPLTVDSQEEDDDRVERDGEGIETVDLGVDAVGRPGKLVRRKAEVVKVAPWDAWKLGREEGWVEPEGTCRGEYSSEETPWDRVMRALTQFITSRSYSYGKAYISHDAEFRSVAGLHHFQSYEPHMRGNAPKQKDGEWIVPGEDEEGSAFVRDMVATLKTYWTKVMGDAHGRIHRITAKESFEIINSFLHYLSQYQILASDPYLSESLTTAISLSNRMLNQISAAQLLCDALPGANTPGTWHALALDAWERGPLRTDEKAWVKHGEEMTRRVEAADFGVEREESLRQNIEEAELEPVEAQGEERVEKEEGEKENGVDWRGVETPDRSAEQAVQTLAVAFGKDASTYKTYELAVTEYRIARLSHDAPNLPSQRLDVRFAQAHAERAGDFYWLTLEGDDERVVLVDGMGLDAVSERDLELAAGTMRVECGLMVVGEGQEETPLVRVVERVIPGFET